MISNLLGIYLDIFKLYRYVDSNTGLAVTKTLSLLDTKGFSSSAELKQNLENILAEFGIQTANIVAIVTDNAANMIKMTEDINDEAIGVNNEVHNDDQDAEIKNDIKETEQLERDNAITLAAVSIDPKYSYVLELEQEVIAVQAITKLLMRLEKPVGDDESIGNDSQDEDAILVRDITEPETEENGYNRLLLLRRASGDVGSKNVEDEVRLCTTMNTSHHHCHLSLLSRA